MTHPTSADPPPPDRPSTPSGPAQLLRSAARWLRRLPDRLRHEERRRDALTRLAAFPLPRSVLFVCLGNICRSPYAEHRFRQQAAGTALEGIVTDSAGFLVAGRAAPSLGQRVAAERGLDLSAHQSRQLDPAVVRQYDLIVVVAPGHARAIARRFGVAPARIVLLGDLDPERIDTREIRDPYDGDYALFASSFTRIDRCLELLVVGLLRGR